VKGSQTNSLHRTPDPNLERTASRRLRRQRVRDRSDRRLAVSGSRRTVLGRRCDGGTSGKPEARRNRSRRALIGE